MTILKTLHVEFLYVHMCAMCKNVGEMSLCSTGKMTIDGSCCCCDEASVTVLGWKIVPTEKIAFRWIALEHLSWKLGPGFWLGGTLQKRKEKKLELPKLRRCLLWYHSERCRRRKYEVSKSSPEHCRRRKCEVSMSLTEHCRKRNCEVSKSSPTCQEEPMQHQLHCYLVLAWYHGE